MSLIPRGEKKLRANHAPPAVEMCDCERVSSLVRLVRHYLGVSLAPGSGVRRPERRGVRAAPDAPLSTGLAETKHAASANNTKSSR
eukprot:1284823-Prymnesium_polylepis.1